AADSRGARAPRRAPSCRDGPRRAAGLRALRGARGGRLPAAPPGRLRGRLRGRREL
ncbi:MAG: hypothetical protein AVDCRST_MAG47-2924, partial [uncultured Nocardioidaceae bacterium]